jgi:hypothetical protein
MLAASLGSLAECRLLLLLLLLPWLLTRIFKYGANVCEKKIKNGWRMYQVHRNPYLQRGAGIGSIFSGLFRSVMPVLSSLGRTLFGSTDAAKGFGKTLADTAVKSGLNVAADAISGQNVGEALKKHLGSARQEVAQAVRLGADKRKSAAAAASAPPGRRRASGGQPSAKKRRLAAAAAAAAAAARRGGRRKLVSVFRNGNGNGNGNDAEDEGDDDES